MRIFLDSNILFSAAIFPSGRIGALYDYLVESEHEIMTSDYVLDEVRRVTAKKRPASNDEVDLFITIWHSNGLTVPTPAEEASDEAQVRDEKDKPVLRAARVAKVDVLLTGDDDLLDAGIAIPEILNAAQLRQRLGLA